MRSHWTNPTILRRPTIAVLSAAALLAACEQPTDPASRPAGGIRADAAAGTVSAKGNGQVPFTSECALPSGGCVNGGRGADFSFAFSGEPTVTGQLAVPVTGRFSVKFRNTGDVAEFVMGPAAITPSQHTLSVGPAVCTFTTAAGVTSGTCELIASEWAQPNSANPFSFFFSGPTVLAQANGPVISGGMQID